MTNLSFDQKKWSRILFYFWCYTLLVILWGAWVRISHSGNGCGDHWPLCGGSFIPTEADHKTWTEYFHRLMSGSYGLFVIYFFNRFRKFNLGSTFQKANVALLILMITEALIGALLVKGQLVTENDSALRLIAMSIHQLNSFLLTGVTYLLYSLVANTNPAKTFRLPKPVLIAFLILPVSGAIAALSSTLFPTISLWQGILDDLAHDQHLFIRLRILHPVLAVVIASGFFYFLYFKNQTRLALEFLFAMAIGVVTLLTLSPVYLKLTHLLIAHYLWSRLIQMFVNLPDSSRR